MLCILKCNYITSPILFSLQHLPSSLPANLFIYPKSQLLNMTISIPTLYASKHGDTNTACWVCFAAHRYGFRTSHCGTGNTARSHHFRRDCSFQERTPGILALTVFLSPLPHVAWAMNAGAVAQTCPLEAFPVCWSLQVMVFCEGLHLPWQRLIWWCSKGGSRTGRAQATLPKWALWVCWWWQVEGADNTALCFHASLEGIYNFVFWLLHLIFLTHVLILLL